MIRLRAALLGLVVCVAVFAGVVGAGLGAQVHTCGQGVVLRAGGALVVDGWTQYDMRPPFPAPGTPTPAPPTGLSDLKPTPYPTAVLLGRSLSDALPVCVELEHGSRCLPLKTVRAMVPR